MEPKQQKQKFNYEFLKKYCEENNIVLLKDYENEKITRNTKIESKCLTYMCDEIVNKNFRYYIDHGHYCKKCSIPVIKNKIKQTCLDKYGTDCPLQNDEIKEKIKQTNLEKYGAEYPQTLDEFKEKTKQTCLDKYGVEYSLQSKKIRDKGKQTTLKKYGVEHATQSKEIQEKTIKTNLEKYGCKRPTQHRSVREIVEQTCLNKYGVKYVTQLKEVQEKTVKTNLEKYGCERASQNEKVREKCKQTCLYKYGVDCPLRLDEVKEKCRQTNLERYGVEYAAQNAEVSERASKNAYKSRDYIFPSGRTERIQGYENFTLDEILQQENIQEDEIIVKRSEVPICWYTDTKGKQRRYFVDCFIKSQNRCIETKSTWTAEKDSVFLKQQALKDAGYECEIWIYDVKGEKLKCYK